MNPTVDGASFEAALVNLYPRLLRCAQRLSASPADAHDLVQDALERGLRRRALFRTGGTPDRWMTTILRRIFLDRCRSARRAADTQAVAALDAGDALDVPAPERVSELFEAADLRRAVGMLEPPFREVYSLFAFDQLSHREIGRRLAMPTSTVGTRLLRARQRLRAIMEANDVPAVPARQWRPGGGGTGGAAAPPAIVALSPNPLPAGGARAMAAL